MTTEQIPGVTTMTYDLRKLSLNPTLNVDVYNCLTVFVRTYVIPVLLLAKHEYLIEIRNTRKIPEIPATTVHL